MKNQLILFFMLTTQIVLSQSGIDQDQNEFYQLKIESLALHEGSKINLAENTGVFLRLGSTLENQDKDYPFILWSNEKDLTFIREDLDPFQEDIRLNIQGDLSLNNLKDTFSRTLLVTAEGIIKSQKILDDFTGIYTATAHDFISYDNPGDDQNYNPALGIIYHEYDVSLITDILVAPIQLPQGVTIKRIDLYFIDNNTSGDIDFWFDWEENLGSDPTGSYIFLGASSGAGPDIQSISINNLDHQIDNLLNHYFFWIRGDSFGWPGDDAGIVAATIYYQ